MRQDANLQIQVEKHLQELASLNKAGTKVKSLRGGGGGGAVEVLVPNRVKWPHEYILSGNFKERISYDQLSVTQWMAGFGRIMKEEKNPEIKDSMFDYLVSLFDNANDFSWDVAKASHAVLLCRMEQGEITSYKGTLTPLQMLKIQKKFLRKLAILCPAFGTCNQPRTLPACFTNGKAFNHAEVNCKNKLKKLSKNE